MAPTGDDAYRRSLDELEGGGLPLRARQRLADEAGPHRKLFTSDLTTNEFLVAREAGMTLISQVMGSSIYHIPRIGDYKGATGEIDAISSAHREARRLALARLQLEAKAVQADVVLGVHLSERLITKGAHGKGGDDGDEVIEFTVVGTAATAPWLAGNGIDPILTDLSGQDLWALHRDGWAPTGMVFEFCRYHVFHVMEGASDGGGEITAATDGVGTARALVADRVIEQAKLRGAEIVVGSDIKVDVHEVPCGYHGCHFNDLDVDVVWYATGIRRVEGHTVKQAVPPLILSMMPLGRTKKRELLEGESESDELAKEGKEEEAHAAEHEE